MACDPSLLFCLPPFSIGKKEEKGRERNAFFLNEGRVIIQEEAKRKLEIREEEDARRHVAGLESRLRRRCCDQHRAVDRRVPGRGIMGRCAHKEGGGERGRPIGRRGFGQFVGGASWERVFHHRQRSAYVGGGGGGGELR